MWFKFIYRTIVLGIVLLLANLAYSHWFWQADMEKHSDIYPKIKALPADIDILYLGESSNITFSWQDLDKRAISDFVGDHFPNLGTYNITQAGAHARIYYEILTAIPDSVEIKDVVVTMNYRSFSSDWIYSELEQALLKKTVLLRTTPPLYNRFLLSFKGFGGYNELERKLRIHADWLIPFKNENLPYKNIYEWDRAIDENGILDSDGGRSDALTILAAANVKNFAFDLNEDNVRVKDFDRIVALAREKGWHLYFSIMPENLENAEKLVGNDLVEMMVNNKNWLVTRYRNMGVGVVDNFDAVAHELFIDKDFPTEHYTETGRKKVAQNVAGLVKSDFPDQFVQIADPATGKRTYFFHDCERQEVWGQMQTISTEKAFEGSKSSKFGGGQAFSLSLDYPFQQIPDSFKTEMDIAFELFAEQPPTDLSLVVELSGEKIDFSWNGFKVSDLKTIEPGQWNPIDFNFKIPAKALQADVVKVYLYAPGQQILFLDNLAIQFK
ncbi:DUF4843 domain-containing protein [bacterium]|nr:DUF4843 domain-containing protein [bacterium]